VKPILSILVLLVVACGSRRAAAPADPTTHTLPASARSAVGPELKVTLLGTGSPIPLVDRFGPSTLVEAGDERLVFDCGRSCTTRLWQVGVPLGTVKLFITHLHSDHTVGIPDLWLTGLMYMAFGTRAEPFRVWGPQGTAAMMTNLEKAYESDLAIRHPKKCAGTTIETNPCGAIGKDFGEGAVYEANGVRVTAFKVAHAEIDAYGFRVDYKGHAVVLSGDTRPNENLIAHARGADVIIHEVGAARAELIEKSEWLKGILSTHHSSPEQAGETFTRIGPKLAVYSHYSLISGALVGMPEIPGVTVDEVLARTRTTYRGPLEAGQDLMTIAIGDTVTVYRPR